MHFFRKIDLPWTYRYAMTEIPPKNLDVPPIISTVNPPSPRQPDRPPIIPKPPPIIMASQTGRWIWFNSQRLSDDALRGLDRICPRRLENGAYWYDRVSGAWGRQGSGPSGHFQAGLDLGGALQSDASGGTSGVFVNGRQLGFWELMRLRRITSFPRGRYWLDARGNFGLDGAPPTGNLRVLEAQANRMLVTALAVNA